MLGRLARYLRFLGHDTLFACDLGLDGPGEDTRLLHLAADEHRILLTRDHELARRGGVLVPDGDVLDQVAALVREGVVEPVLSLDRCSRCNTLLRPATENEAGTCPHAQRPEQGRLLWCSTCRQLYWLGSHVDRLTERLDQVARMAGPPRG